MLTLIKGIMNCSFISFKDYITTYIIQVDQFGISYAYWHSKLRFIAKIFTAARTSSGLPSPFLIFQERFIH